MHYVSAEAASLAQVSGNYETDDNRGVDRGGGLGGAEAPPKRGMGAHARGVDRGMEGSWCGGACRKNVKSY
jgi:hypothetical protein